MYQLDFSRSTGAATKVAVLDSRTTGTRRSTPEASVGSGDGRHSTGRAAKPATRSGGRRGVIRMAAARGGHSGISELVQAAGLGDADAWSALIAGFNGLVRGIARSCGLKDADVDDVSQVVWLRLFKHLNRLRDAERLGGWLATTTRRECYRVLHQHTRTRAISDLELLVASGEADGLRLEPTRQDEAERLRFLIQALPDHQRPLLEMLLREPQPSYQEISDALKIPIGSIGPTRQRSLAALRAKCETAGLEPDPA